jgi:hypothetical protein
MNSGKAKARQSPTKEDLNLNNVIIDIRQMKREWIFIWLTKSATQLLDKYFFSEKNEFKTKFELFGCGCSQFTVAEAAATTAKQGNC